jgi:hypothetical protein
MLNKLRQVGRGVQTTAVCHGTLTATLAALKTSICFILIELRFKVND